MKQIMINFITDDMSDDEIRDIVIKRFTNGSYMNWICRCGNYNMSIEGDTRTCKIKKVCSKCFESKQRRICESE